MAKQIAGGVSITTLFALALIVIVKLVGVQTTASVKAQNKPTQTDQATQSQTDKPFDQAQALADLRKPLPDRRATRKRIC